MCFWVMGCPQNPQIIYQKSSPPRQAEEQCVSSVLDKFRMRYDVPVELSTVGDFSDFPWIKPSDFLRTMARTGDFFRLLGGKNIGEAKSTMKVFWDRYRKIVPHHGIFKSKLAGQLQNCLPLFCHGDEGTGYKKKGVLVVSFQSPFGYGGRHAPNQQDPCCQIVFIHMLKAPACF